MFRLIFSIACMIAISYEAYAVQIIHRSDNNRSRESTYELNRLEEQQELLRRQVQIQQEILNLQRQQQLQQQLQQKR